MVKPEKYDFTKDKLPREIQRSTASLELSKLERPANGAWFGTVTITIAVEMKDGREVFIRKEVRLRGIQDGRRPNPKAFKAKTK